jgi:TonB-dependent SusC/RagA subfamily outer membrane receptor
MVAVRADGSADSSRTLLISDSVRLTPSKRPFDGLLFVDGVKTDPAAMSKINPNSIESVEVIKGAAAAQKYGAEGANGVIVITTKK